MTVYVIKLTPHPGSREPAGTIVWDAEAGEIRGSDEFSEYIRRRIALAEQYGSTPAHPSPRNITIIDPLRDVAEMAAILGWSYVLPDWLMEKYPKAPSEEPFDDDGGEPMVDVIH